MNHRILKCLIEKEFKNIEVNAKLGNIDEIFTSYLKIKIHQAKRKQLEDSFVFYYDDNGIFKTRKRTKEEKSIYDYLELFKMS